MSAEPTSTVDQYLPVLEDVLCERFKVLGDRFLKIRVEIISHVEDIIKDSVEEAWDVNVFAWKVLRGWTEHGLTNLKLPPQPEGRRQYTLPVANIQSLCFLPAKSNLDPWDHACLCAAELCNEIRTATGQPEVCFQALLRHNGIAPPTGIRQYSDADVPLLDNDVTSWAYYIRRLEAELSRFRESNLEIKRRNMELAYRLSEVQSELAGYKAPLAGFKAPLRY
ncbi:uncharacterized protein MAM_07476 [Metarhizium album ARSEF 1941]|uniref:Uncharacterized protein n=1 Tax=Metarhizium album (strain ARSEF 1941) TaxID=1081103 RepID=A0A0B2WFL1_METAS|nr:uncharacterized protein MAM_07476 [Metarhizium album ARSEF 1941]KHN94721.1 hypothetical protein MAM_07476 [Metarhizium album ARSEF 1941]